MQVGVNMKKGIVFTVLTSLFCIFFLTGCIESSTEKGKIRDLEYTVVCEDNLPEELQKGIKERKAKEFKISYSDGSFLYICRGYGEQETGGYSIRVTDLYLSEDGIVFATEFIGPDKSENVPQVSSYPVITVKTEIIDKPLIFE